MIIYTRSLTPDGPASPTCSTASSVCSSLSRHCGQLAAFATKALPRDWKCGRVSCVSLGRASLSPTSQGCSPAGGTSLQSRSMPPRVLCRNANACTRGKNQRSGSIWGRRH